MFKNRDKHGDFEFSLYWLIPTDSFSHQLSAFSLCKMPRNNFNSDYSTALSIQFHFYFPKLYFSLLIKTQIDGIIKQQLVLVNLLNKTIWKEAVNIAIRKFFYTRYHSKKHGQVRDLVSNIQHAFNI